MSVGDNDAELTVACRRRLENVRLAVIFGDLDIWAGS